MKGALRRFGRGRPLRHSLYPNFKSRVRQTLAHYPDPHYDEETFQHFSYKDYQSGKLYILDVAESCLIAQPDELSDGFAANPFGALKQRRLRQENKEAADTEREWYELTADKSLADENPSLERQAFIGYLYRKTMKEIWQEEWIDHPQEQAADRRIVTRNVSFTPAFLRQLNLEGEKKYYDYMKRMGPHALNRPNNRILPLKQLAIALKGLPPSPRDRGSPQLVTQTQMHYFLNRLYFQLAPAAVKQQVFSRFPDHVGRNHVAFTTLYNKKFLEAYEAKYALDELGVEESDYSWERRSLRGKNSEADGPNKLSPESEGKELDAEKEETIAAQE